jgi:hypothetical protein
MKNALEQATETLTNMKDEIIELKALRDAATIPSFKEDYQKKVTEKVNEYNAIIKKLN